MALTPVQRIRWIIADAEGGKFYPILTNEQIEDALEIFNNDILKTASFCAGAVIRELSQMSTKERYGEVEVWAEDRKLYSDSLKQLQTDLLVAIPSSFLPYAAGISVDDMTTSAADEDNPRRSSYLYTNTTECCDGYDFPTSV